MSRSRGAGAPLLRSGVAGVVSDVGGFQQQNVLELRQDGSDVLAFAFPQTLEERIDLVHQRILEADAVGDQADFLGRDGDVDLLGALELRDDCILVFRVAHERAVELHSFEHAVEDLDAAARVVELDGLAHLFGRRNALVLAVGVFGRVRKIERIDANEYHHCHEANRFHVSSSRGFSPPSMYSSREKHPHGRIYAGVWFQI